METFLRKCRTLGRRLAGPELLFWTLPLMMVLVVAGTWAQKTMGGFEAQKTYFASAVVFLGGKLPFPGGVTLMAVIFVNLLARFLLGTRWSWAKAGIHMAHFGALLLIVGAGVTVLSSREGYLLIPEGERRSAVADYHQKQVVISRDGLPLLSFRPETVAAGQKIAIPGEKKTIEMTSYCSRCDLGEGGGKRVLLPPRAKTGEEGISGMTFLLGEEAGMTFEGDPSPPVLGKGKNALKIVIGGETRLLPFSIELVKFDHDRHPGTQMAKAYSSRLVVHDGGMTWPGTVRMNAPLRYRGYSFYQSSFDLSGEKPATILAVVENRGRIFPYIASALMAMGLMLHLLVRIGDRRNAI